MYIYHWLYYCCYLINIFLVFFLYTFFYFYTRLYNPFKLVPDHINLLFFPYKFTMVFIPSVKVSLVFLKSLEFRCVQYIFKLQIICLYIYVYVLCSRIWSKLLFIYLVYIFWRMFCNSAVLKYKFMSKVFFYRLVYNNAQKRFLWCTQHFRETWIKTESISCEHKIFLNPELRLEPSPVNTTFYDLKPRLSCKWRSMNVYHLHQIFVYTRESST